MRRLLHFMVRFRFNHRSIIWNSFLVSGMIPVHPSDEILVGQFGVIRHAQTVWNASGRIQGQQDSPLTEIGRQDAIRWAHLLAPMAWDRIFASDLGRAMETATLIASVLDLPIASDARLREMDWGVWTGLTMPQIRSHFPMLWEQASAGDWAFAPPEGERYLDVYLRVSSALQHAAFRYPKDRMLVICHEGTLKCLYYHPESRRPDAMAPIPAMQSGCLQCFGVDGKGIYLVRPNAMVLGASPKSRPQRGS